MIYNMSEIAKGVHHSSSYHRKPAISDYAQEHTLGFSQVVLDKKGQLTVFIILGITLVLLAMLLFMFRPGLKVEQAIKVPIEMQPIKNYVDDCLKDASTKGILLLGVQGGRIFEKGDELQTNYSNISYGYYEGRDVLPSIAEMEYDISKYVGIALPLCTNFSIFNKFNITYENLTVSTKIIANEVVIEVNYPIQTKTADFEGSMDRFIYNAPVRLGHDYNIAKSIINRTIYDPEWVDMTFLSDFDVFVSVIPYDKEKFVYSLADDISSINGQPYNFLFANKFVVNQPPVLNIPDTFRFKDTVPVNIKLNATDPENDSLTFSDDTAMFDISEDGVILFIPEVPGTFDAVITLEDDHRNMVSKAVKIIVE